MIVFYSGEGSRSNPEITLGDHACLMLTYEDMRHRSKPTSRFREIMRVRKKRRSKRSSILNELLDNTRDHHGSCCCVQCVALSGWSERDEKLQLAKEKKK